MSSISRNSDSDDTIHLQDYLEIILRRRFAFIIVFSAIFLSVAAYTFLMKPVYEAMATLHVKEEKGKLSLIEELTLNPSNPIDAELQILKSRTNAEKVVKRLHLDLNIIVENGAPAFKLLEFTSDPDVSYFIITLTGNDSYEVADDKGNTVGNGKNGVLTQGKALTLLLDGLRGTPGDRIRVEPLPFNGVVRELRESIRAEEAARKTNIISLSYASTNPELAKEVVNTLVQVYLEQTVAFKTEEASRTVDFLEEQLENVKKDLDIAERNLQVFKSTTGVVHLDTEAEELIKKFSITEKEKAGITVQKKQIEFALESLREAQQKGETYSPAVLRDDPLVSEMARKLADLEVQKQALLADYTDEHPLVKTVREQIIELQNKIRSTYETGMKNLDSQESNITRHLARYEGELKRLPEAERELARLTRLHKVNADIYTFLLQKHEEARIAKASTISNIDIVDPAIVPEEPVKPRIPLYLVLGLLAACISGVAVTFFLEYLDDTIKDAEIAKRELHLPLLAIIPFIPMEEGDTDRQKHISLIAHYEPKSSVSEAFRSLRTSIHFSSVSKKRQVLMVTSSLPYEGKTTIMGNLAIILSQTGARVLLVDCDLRRASLHDLYGHKKSPGLTELLAGDNGLDAMIHATGIHGLDFISSGTTPPNPAELLGSEKMQGLLRMFRERYDTILIDAPPILPVTDALLLSSMTDMVFMILELGRVPIKAALHAREMLQQVGAPLAGIVLNDRTERHMPRYGYYGKRYYRYSYGYYGYGHYGEESQKLEKKVKKSWWRSFRKK